MGFMSFRTEERVFYVIFPKDDVREYCNLNDPNMDLEDNRCHDWVEGSVLV